MSDQACVNSRRGQWKIGAWLLVALTALQAASAVAGGVVVTIIDGRKAKAEISLPNPAGEDYSAEFEIEFETDGLVNLTPACVGISADVLDAGEIANVHGRLPHPATQAIDPAFPVRVTVDPPAGCGLAFNNQYDVSIDTENLLYAPFSPYRFVKAPVGGLFRYVTGAVVSGSIRTRGRAGGFSEFVVIKDTAPDFSADTDAAYDALAARLANTAISLTARHALGVDLGVSRAAYVAGNYAQAVAHLANFDAHCAAYGGVALPNRWRSANDLDNIEGDLVGYADNLRFLLGRLGGAP